MHRVTGGGTWQVTATEFGASSLSVGLASPVTTVSPGGSFPFTLTMDNQQPDVGIVSHARVEFQLH